MIQLELGSDLYNEWKNALSSMETEILVTFGFALYPSIDSINGVVNYNTLPPHSFLLHLIKLLSQNEGDSIQSGKHSLTSVAYYSR
jgi:hypothetical protein